MQHLLSCAYLLLLVLTYVHGQLDSRWKLLWSDEFNGSTIDTTKWNVVTTQGLQGNGEKEYYLPEQVYVQDGNLVLRSDNISYVSAFPYRSGEVNSQGRFSGTFGRYEVRAKIPGGKGLWPAFWLLSEYLCWPVGTEFDIMEAIGDKHNIFGTVHYSSKCYTGIANGSVYAAPFDYTQDYHIYAFEWNQTSISWFVDDVNFKVAYDETVDNGKPFAIDTSPHYWILNTAVGGYWPGYPDASVVFPQYNYVDYVRVYAWEPCVVGCGNGCCYEPLQICICDENYEGSNCEYIAQGKNPGTKANCNMPPTPAPTPMPTPSPTAPPCVVPPVTAFTRDFSTPYNASIDIYGNSTQGPTQELPDNAKIVSGKLQLSVTTQGCPSQCAGQQYSGAVYSTVENFNSGTFQFKMKASNVSGTAVVFWLNGWDSKNGWNAYQFVIPGNNPTQISTQSFWGGYQNINGGQYDLGFDASQDFHTYTFQYHPEEITSLYADGKLIFTVAPGPLTVMALRIEYFVNPSYYGKYAETGTTYVYVEQVDWTTNCGSHEGFLMSGKESHQIKIEY